MPAQQSQASRHGLPAPPQHTTGGTPAIVEQPVLGTPQISGDVHPTQVPDPSQTSQLLGSQVETQFPVPSQISQVLGSQVEAQFPVPSQN